MKWSLRSRLRQVLPSPVYVVIAILLIAGLEILWLVFDHLVGAGPACDKVLVIRDHTVITLLALYGMYRVFTFHPFGNSEYRAWLQQTPWQRGLPLPVGTVSPDWADLIVVTAVGSLLTDPRIPFEPDLVRPTLLSALQACILAHATVLSFFVWLTHPRWLAYIALFMLALTTQLGAWAPLAAPVALAIGWTASLYGLHRSWTSFPWDASVEWGAQIRRRWKTVRNQSSGLTEDDSSPDRIPVQELGWPFGAMSPWVPTVTVGTGERLLIATLAGWWMHAFLMQIPVERVVTALGAMILLYGTMILCIARILMYGGNHSSPLGLFGRLATFRWIIPAYDRIFLGPLLIAVVPLVLGVAGHQWMQVTPHILFPVVAVLTLWTFVLVGPSPVDWKLTAPVHVVPGRMNKRSFDQLS